MPLQPSPELDKVQPFSQFRENVELGFKKMLDSYNKSLKTKITEDDLKLIEDKMREMTNSNEVYVGIRFKINDLEKILADGRFKSQFETRTSGGYFNDVLRADMENTAMGYGIKSTKPKDRPIYGMLFDGKTPSDIKASDEYMRSGCYGSVVAIFKPEIKRYATVGFGDSLMQKNMVLLPLLNPSRYSMPSERPIFIEIKNLAKAGELKPSQFKKIRYAEVQIHGGQATVSNIDRIIFARNTPKEKIPVNELKKYGVKWEMEK